MLPGNLPEVFLDTDASFDIISKKEPHYPASIRLLQLAAEDKVRLIISESSLANLFYLTFDIYKIEDPVSRLLDFIATCDLVSAGKDQALLAVRSGFKDKEDALQYYTAVQAKADYLVTRNIKDYKHRDSALPVLTPDDLTKILK